MTALHHPKSALLSVIHTLVTGEELTLRSSNTPPEIALYVAGPLGALPDAHYVVWDPEDSSFVGVLPSDSQFEELVALPSEELATWSGEEVPGMLGYGNLGAVTSRAGPGLRLTLAGGAHCAGDVVWVLPVGAL